MGCPGSPKRIGKGSDFTFFGRVRAVRRFTQFLQITGVSREQIPVASDLALGYNPASFSAVALPPGRVTSP